MAESWQDNLNARFSGKPTVTPQPDQDWKKALNDRFAKPTAPAPIITETPKSEVSVFNNPKPYQTTQKSVTPVATQPETDDWQKNINDRFSQPEVSLGQQKSYPTPPKEPDQPFLQKTGEVLDNIKTFILGGYTQKEKEMMGGEEITPKINTKPEKITVNGGQIDIPKFVDPDTLDKSKQPKLSTPKPQIDTPEWNAWQEHKQGETKALQQKIDTAKINPEEYFIKAVTFGYAGDTNKAPAVTLSQKGMELVGSIVAYMTLSHYLAPALGGIISKIPGGANVAKTVENLAQKYPWRVGYPLSVAKSATLGTVGGALEKADNIQERARNAVNGGETFAAFDAIAYPVVSFFRPTFYSLGKVERIKFGENAKNILPNGTSIEELFTQPKEIWFRNPEDPTLLLKVTQSTVPGKANIDIVPAEGAGVDPKTLPLMTKTTVEAFKSEPSTYQKLTEFLNHEPVTIPEDAVKGEISQPVEDATVNKTSPEAQETATESPIVEKDGNNQPAEFLSAYEQLKGQPKGITIEDPNVRIGVGNLSAESKKTIDTNSDTVELTKKSLKHIAEKPESFPEHVVKQIPNIIQNPTEIRKSKNALSGENRYLFVKQNGEPKASVVEVSIGKNKNTVVTVFKTDKAYLSNFNLLWRTGPASTSIPPSAYPQEADAGSGPEFSALKGDQNLKGSSELNLTGTDNNVKVKREKPVVQQKIDLISEGGTAEKQAQILIELENAKAGQRIRTVDDGQLGESWISQSSTFPKWIPENLRKKVLTDAVLNHINNDTVPTKADEVRLYNLIAERLGLSGAIKETGAESEIDVSEMFAENINEQISNIGQPEKGVLEESNSREIESKEISPREEGSHSERGQVKEGKKIKHYTLSENIQSILDKGFDTSKKPIHGIGGLEKGEKTAKFGGDNLLYFTTDSDRWNKAQIYVGEGKGDISREYYDYEKQGWSKEENAYKKVNLSPVEATIKSNAKVLIVDNLDKAIELIKKENGKFDRYNFVNDLVNIARKNNYDILNINTNGNWASKELGTNKYGEDDWHRLLTGNSGKDDYFILNKDILEISKPEKPKLEKGSMGFKPKADVDLEGGAFQKETKKIIKKSEIADELSRKLGMPIRRGKFSAMGALGIFKREPQIVRIKKGGLATVFHEVGHFLDANYHFSDELNAVERKALMEEYGYSYANQPKRQKEEGFAEFLRYIMTGQEAKAEQAAPEFFDYWNSQMEILPQIKQVVETATKDFKRWKEMPATSKVLSQISIGAQKGKPLAQRFSQGLHQLYTMALDDLHPLSEFSKIANKNLGKVSAEKDPYILARNLRGWVGKANTFLTKGTFGKDYWTLENGKVKAKFKGKSFQAIMLPIEKAGALDDFRVYIVSKRALEIGRRNMLSGILKKDAETAIAELDKKYPEFEKNANELYKYQDDLLFYAAENGLLGQKGLAKIKELNQFRVPFYRVMEEAQGAGYMGKSKMAGNMGSPIKKIKGSEREIIDPIESIIKDTYAIVNSAERNNIGVSMANLAKKDKDLGRLFEMVARPMKPTRVNMKEIMDKVADSIGMSTEDMPEELAEMMITVFRPTQDRGPNMLNVNLGDKQAVFQVESDLFKTIQGLNAEDVGMIFRILSFPSRLLRAGATLSPDFSVRNPIRDQFSAVVYSKYGFKPGIDLAKGIFELFKKADVYDLWRMGGGEHSMLVSLDREHLQENYKELMRSTGKQVIHHITHPIETLQMFSEITEQATRLGEMKRALESEKNPVQAAYASREVTLDFARVGTKTKAINSLIAFFNSNMQGQDKMVRAFKARPFQTLVKALLWITLPSVLLYFHNRKDPRWKEIPAWQKDLFWIVMTPKHIWRIPKPFELGILFGSVPERILEFLDNHDSKIFNELETSIANGATPGFMPTFMQPIIENITNYSFFLDRPIVPQGTENLPAEAQVGTYTSETAKIIGDALNYSPSKIDNLIYGYTGGLGRYVTLGIDKIITGTGIKKPPVAPEGILEDYPVIKAFMIKPPVGTSSESVNRVYEMYSKASGELQYVQKLIKEGRVEDAKNFVKENPDVIYGNLLNVTISSFSTINQIRNQIRNAGLISAKAKQEKIRQLDELQTKMAEKILERVKPGAE